MSWARKPAFRNAAAILFVLGLAGLLLPRWLHASLGGAFAASAAIHAFGWRSAAAPLFRGGPGRWKSALPAALLAVSVLLCATGLGLLFPDALPASSLRAWHLGLSCAALPLLFAHALLAAARGRARWKSAAFAGLAFIVSVSAVFVLPYMDRWLREVSFDVAETASGPRVTVPGRLLTAYFTRTGNTLFPEGVSAVSGASLVRDSADGSLHGNAEVLARMAAGAAGGDIVAIRTEKRYPASYSETTREARAELDNAVVPLLAMERDLPDPASYDTLVLVFPVWWGTVPKAVESFLLAQGSLAGKRILPVATHGGSRSGETLARLRAVAPGARVSEPLAVYSSSVEGARGEIARYIAAELKR